MSAAVPVTQGMISAGAQGFQSEARANAAPPSMSAGAYMGEHNTPMHVAAIALVALGVVVALHVSGFRFAFDVGLGRG